MSFRAVLDLSLSIDSFRNVGMFQQGVYYLTYQIYYLIENKKVYANPYSNIPFIYSATPSKKSFRNVESSEIIEDQYLFKTRAFTIRYRHEEIPMNEVCQFRTEVDTDKDGEYLHTPFYVESKLHFLRHKFENGASIKSVEKLMKTNRDQIKVVSTQKFKLSGCMSGITEYLPITFKGVYFSVSHGIIHTALIDFRWRDQLLIDYDNEMEENGIYVETERKLSISEHQAMVYRYSYRPDNLMHYLLSQEKDFYVIKYKEETLELIFDVFISPLILNWENLKRMYETLLVEEHESIFINTKPLSKIESNCQKFEFCGHKDWVKYADEEESKLFGADKENQPVEREQASGGNESDEEGNLDVGEEVEGIQKIYRAIDVPKQFFLNYNSLKDAFVKRVYNKNPNGLVKNIENEIRTIAGQIIQCNYELMMLIGTAPAEIREHFCEKHLLRTKERVEDSVFRSYIKTKDFAISGDNDNRELYKIMAEKRRSNVYEELLDDLPVEDMTNLTHDLTPVMVEEIYTLENSSQDTKISRKTRKQVFGNGLHLFVLVHGFQATHIDMQEIKNHIAIVVPNSIFLCSESNEGSKTDG